MEREALKLALETFESMNHDDSIFKGEFDEEIAVIKKALAQPAQEPVDMEVMAASQRKPLTQDGTMEIANQTAGQYWMDEAHIQRFRAAVEAAHGIGE